MKKSQTTRGSALSRDQDIVHRAGFHAARFLRAPVSNVLRYHVARVLRMLPLLPAGLRDAFDLSARKRDFRALSRALASRPEPEGLASGPDLTADFRKSLAARRWRTLLSDDHLHCHAACRAGTPDTPLTLSIVTYNSARWLEGFFASLRAQHYPLSRLTLRIADHGSTDDTVAKVEGFIAAHGAQFRRAEVVVRDNDGFGGGHDANIATSDDDFVLVTNVDLEFGPDTLTGLVATALVDAADVACWEARQCPFEHPKFYDPVTRETAWCSHACILIRRSAYHAVGGYERRIFMYGEDVELSFRLRGAGWRLRYLPHVPVRHFVDFDDTTLRPHQLTGSVSANVLLRYRYGGDDAGDAGAWQVAQAASHDRDPARRAALVDALDRIDRDREHFRTTHVPARRGIFPFDGFDYDIARRGHDVALDSLDPIPDAPTVTIVTRTHGPNQAILRDAIASVLNQTYANIEHLVVEDRGDLSEPLVTEVARTYGANIRFLRSDRGGRSAAGNDGLAAATGDLLLFLDNDDLLFADHVELLVRALRAAPDCVAAYSLAWEMETFFTASGAYRDGSLSMPPAYAKPYNPKRFEAGNFLPIQSVLFRRRLFDDFGGIDEQIDHLEDWNLWARYAQAGPFRLVPKTTSIYRVPGDPVFREERRQVMLAAEDAVRRKTFGTAASRAAG